MDTNPNGNGQGHRADIPPEPLHVLTHVTDVEMLSAVVALERRETNGETVPVAPYSLWSVCAAAQLAMRHPGMSPRLRAQLRLAAERMIETLGPEYPAMFQTGFDQAR